MWLNYNKYEIMRKVLIKLYHSYTKPAFATITNIRISSNEKIEEMFKDKFKYIKLKPVVSYTTRKKRETETDGIQHYFIDDKTAEEKIINENIITYSQIGEIKYFITEDCLIDSNIYIIDPQGLYNIKNKLKSKIIKSIYISTPDSLRFSHRSDFNTSFQKRNDDENDQFTYFEETKKYDYLIENIELEKSLIEFIFNICASYSENTLYCIMGRTGAGKDILTNEVIKFFN